MSDTNPQTAKAEVLNPLQIAELGAAVGRAAMPLASELGGPEDIQRVITSPLLQDALRPVLLAIAKGEGVASPGGSAWPSSLEVYKKCFGLDLYYGSHFSHGEKPPVRGHLTKPMIIPHSTIYNGAYIEDFLTLDKVIEVMRQHFSVILPHDAELITEVVDLRTPAVGGEATYQIRFDERSWKGESSSDQPEKVQQTPLDFFRDPNHIAMTLRECLLICFFYWLSTNKEAHLFEGIPQICAGTLDVSTQHCFEVRTWKGGLVVEKVLRGRCPHGRVRQVALLPANRGRYTPPVIQKKEVVRINLPVPRKETARITLPPTGQ